MNKKFSEHSDEEFQKLRDDWVAEALDNARVAEMRGSEAPPDIDRLAYAINGLMYAQLASMVTSRNGWGMLKAIMNGVSTSLRGLRH